MDRYDLSTRACTKLADLKIAKIAILVSVAAGIMSGFPVARKALKGAGSVCAFTLVWSVVILELTTLGDLGRHQRQTEPR